jgi:hypothetical protein
MNAKQLGAILLLIGASAFGQANEIPIPAQPVQRGANYCLWQGQNAVTNQDGSIALQTNSYVELATGLNFIDANGQWTPSTEQIQILNDGSALANQAPHQVQFPADIYSGDLVITMPDGQTLNAHPAGLAYFDGDKSVLIAQLTNSTGVIVNNQVIYTNCLVSPDFEASLRFTFTKAGLEQDVILQAKPDPPESFGLDSSHSSLLVLTEFTNSPAPTVVTRTVTEAGLSAADDSLAWPAMQMGQGKAFLIGGQSSPIYTTKTWDLLDGVQYLVEQAPVSLLAPQWQNLPTLHASLHTKKYSRLAANGLPTPLPRQRRPAQNARITRLANNVVSSGLVVDFILINSTLTNYVFQSDSTYYISAPVYLFDSATFESAVIKYTNNASLTTGTSFTLNSLAAPFAPTLFLSKDDNSAGSTITGSTGSPTNQYANPALAIESSSVSQLSHFRIACAQQAITTSRRPRHSTTARLSIAATALPQPSAAPRFVIACSPTSRMFSTYWNMSLLMPKTPPLADPIAPLPLSSHSAATHPPSSSPTAFFPTSPPPPPAPTRTFMQILTAFMPTADPLLSEAILRRPPLNPFNKLAPAISIWRLAPFSATPEPPFLTQSCSPNFPTKPPRPRLFTPTWPFPLAQPWLPSRLAPPA